MMAGEVAEAMICELGENPMKNLGRETAKPGLWGPLKESSRRMRTNPTPAENVLWQRLRNHSLGVKFRRQHVIDRFVVDFVCLNARLIVEVDGEIHRDQSGQDAARDAVLQSFGYRVLRFTNRETTQSPETLIARIRAALAGGELHHERTPSAPDSSTQS
jgi:histidinol dehydrogenase